MRQLRTSPEGGKSPSPESGLNLLARKNSHYSVFIIYSFGLQLNAAALANEGDESADHGVTA